MDSIDRNDAEVSRLTHDYHKTVLGLTQEFFGSQIAWKVSQHVLDKLWDDTASNEDPAKESDITSIAHACQACGYRLHPGFEGTSLRIKRPNPISTISKRTKRRRLLRQRKRDALDAASKANRNRRHKAPPRTLAKTAAAETISYQKLVLLRDDETLNRSLDRNHLVLTCGRCKDKTYLKGLRRDSSNANEEAAEYNPTKKKNTSQREFKMPKNGSLSENFERLPKLSKAKPLRKGVFQTSPPPNAVAAAPKAAPAPPKGTLLEQKLGKKKKKKSNLSNPKKSGNLMDFLSSLNNH